MTGLGALFEHLQANVSLRPLTTLKAGGPAEWFAVAQNRTQLADITVGAQKGKYALTILGWGSNMLPSDQGVPGITLWNRARSMEFHLDGTVEVDTGCAFQDLFLQAAQRRFGGLEYAVGIPGTVGGALVSNAGAYRSNIGEFITSLQIVTDGKIAWVEPSFLEFSYRNSILRKPNPPPIVVLAIRMKLPRREPHEIYREARDYQQQRISKQPPQASAGSFFKNVEDPKLAEELPNLPERLKKAGVVPSGYLIQEVGLMGFTYQGAMLSPRHANFIINSGGASATAIRQLAAHARRKVSEKFGVMLEEEVLYLGDWTGYADLETL